MPELLLQRQLIGSLFLFVIYILQDKITLLIILLDVLLVDKLGLQIDFKSCFQEEGDVVEQETKRKIPKFMFDKWRVV